MSAEEKDELLALIERGDKYRLMLKAVAIWTRESHPESSHSAVYAFHGSDVPPVRITIPASTS
jgi:hypothetical protein